MKLPRHKPVVTLSAFLSQFAALADDDGELMAAQVRIANSIGISRQSSRRLLSEAENRGYVTRNGLVCTLVRRPAAAPGTRDRLSAYGIETTVMILPDREMSGRRIAITLARVPSLERPLP